jgi:hypothetical protein
MRKTEKCAEGPLSVLGRPFWATNCSEAVLGLATGGRYSGVIKDIKSWEHSFISCNFVHESRDSNFEPHTLARHTLLIDQGRHVWLGLPHDPDILPIFLNIDQ